MQDVEYLSDFWKTHYLDSYIADGGAKVKFLTGSSASGKTRALRAFLSDAEQSGYKAVYISAKETWLHDFKEIYLSVFDAVGFEGLIDACARRVTEELGYGRDDVPPGTLFADFLMEKNSFDPLTKREIRERLRDMLFRNTWIDNNFAISAALMTSGVLGYPVLEPAAKDLLLGWYRGQKEARVSALRKLGLSPSRITKFNARHMLRSLIEIIRIAGFRGLVVAVDDLDAIMETSSLQEIRYTKMRREDTYESIRELIDGLDTFSHFMLCFAFDGSLVDDEAKGFKSYQALWMRIQNEIEGTRLNRFSDMIDLNGRAGWEGSGNV
jgi:hypothetical protein